MEQYQCKVVDLGYYDNKKSVIVKVIDDEQIEICTEIDGIIVSISDQYYLETYQKFRDELLKLGYGLMCNGSRINAIQSGMMGYSEKVYLVEMGKQALREQIVSMWEFADIKTFPNTKEQLVYAQQWYESLKS